MTVWIYGLIYGLTQTFSYISVFYILSLSSPMLGLLLIALGLILIHKTSKKHKVLMVFINFTEYI